MQRRTLACWPYDLRCATTAEPRQRKGAKTRRRKGIWWGNCARSGGQGDDCGEVSRRLRPAARLGLQPLRCRRTLMLFPGVCLAPASLWSSQFPHPSCAPIANDRGMSRRSAPVTAVLCAFASLPRCVDAVQPPATRPTAPRRHRSEQYLTCSQSRAHFFRHANGLPQARQSLEARSEGGQARLGRMDGMSSEGARAVCGSDVGAALARVGLVRVCF